MVNKVILVGFVGRDAELRYTPSGVPVASFSMATSEVWNGKDGTRQEKTEWHRVQLWGNTAQSLAEYLLKGKNVYVDGKIEHRKYTDKDGIERHATDIRAFKVVLLGSAPRVQRSDHVRDEDVGHGEPAVTTSELTEDDIPF